MKTTYIVDTWKTISHRWLSQLLGVQEHRLFMKSLWRLYTLSHASSVNPKRSLYLLAIAPLS